MLEQLSLSWLQQVADLPINWALCAVAADKRPYHPDNQKGQGWQLSGLERSRFVTLNGHFAAVGLLTGPLSGGLVAIDHDGHSADEKIEELSGVTVAEALPITVGFTSQRDGRYQLLYSIPEELWSAVKTRKYPTGTKAADSGKGEALEFRWAGAQSVILGAHPTTTGYRWLDRRSPWEVEVAPAPDWIIMAMRDETPEHVAIARTEWQMERSLETPIPLINLATKKHRQHINDGVGEGGRNDAGAAIARDLIGCERWAISSNVYFDGNAKALFWQFAQRSGLSESEAKTIWRSAERGTPHPACSDEGLQSVLKSWERKNGSKMTQKKVEGNGGLKVVAEPITQNFFDLPVEAKSINSRLIEIKKELAKTKIEDGKREQLKIEKIELTEKLRIINVAHKKAKREESPEWMIRDQAIGRPVLQYRANNLPDCLDAVLGTFVSQSDPLEKIYYQGGSNQWLCRILRSNDRAETIEILDHDKLKNSIDKKMSFYKLVGESKKMEPIDCPLPLSKHILSESRWPSLSPLKGISNIPLLQSDGSISAAPGYDEESQFILEFNPDDFKLIEDPTKEDALKALEVLKDLIKESEFKTEVDRAGALAMFLTAISRRLYDRAPLFAIDATRPGIGKGTLIDMVTTILTGNRSSGTLITFSPDEEEFRKKILSTLIEGLPILNIDNVKDGELGGATIESALTNSVHKDRFLGASKNVHVSTQIVWTANGNNIRLSKDLQRRSIIIKLDSNVANLDQRKFSMSDHELENHLRINRSKLVSAALTVVQAFILEAPQMDWPKPLSSFAHWDSIVRRSLLWLGQEDPVKTQEQFKDEDDGESTLSVLMTAWYTEHNNHGITLKDLMAVTAPSQYGKTEDQSALEEALKDICFDYRSQTFNTSRLKKYLADNKGNMAGPYKLLRTDEKRRNYVVWKVSKVIDDDLIDIPVC